MGEWPLVGRAGELRLLKNILASDVRGLVLAGPAGVGKTRLALTYLEMAEQRGAAIVRVSATRAAGRLPLGAFAPLLPALHERRKAGVDDRADLLRRCARALMESAAGRPLVLFADDAHHLDDASATLIHEMAVAGAAFIVATVLTGVPAPELVTALWKDDAVERLEVGGLRTQAIGELLPAVLGGPVDRATVHRLAIGSQGNVLFLRELVLGSLQDGTLRNDVGIWRLAGPPSVSNRLTALIEARLEGLTEEERNLLEVIAFGEPLGPMELSTIADLAVAQSLERQALLSSRKDGRRLELRLAHSLYGEVVRAGIPSLRAREVARTLAEALERTGARRREDILRVATWQLEGGVARPDFMVAAATAARWGYDFPLAERLARQAAQAGAGFDAHLLAAELAGLQGDAARAEQELASLAGAAADDRQRGLVAIHRLDNHVFLGQVDEGLRLAEEAEGLIDDPAWRDEISSRRAAVLAGTHGPRVAAEVAEPLLGRATGRALVWAAMVASFSLARLGRLDDALAAADRGLEAHQGLDEPMAWYPWMHTFFRSEALAHLGEFEAAHALALEQYEQGVADRSPEAQAWFARQLCKGTADRGCPRSAAVFGRTSVVLFRQLGRPQFEYLALCHLAQALALSGEPVEATRTLAVLDALGLPASHYWEVDVIVARAWVSVAAGDLPSARALLEKAAATGGSIGDLVGAATALHTLARLGYAEGVTDQLSGLAGQIGGPLARARAEHAQALTTSDPQRLERVSDAFEQMGAWLLAAEAASDAAVCWAQQGERRASARVAQRAGLLAQRCEDPVVPALGVSNRSVLTRAERQVALLAASGQTNKEIAAKLVVSVRTVENQLQRVYEKLGVSGRSDLPADL